MDSEGFSDNDDDDDDDSIDIISVHTAPSSQADTSTIGEGSAAMMNYGDSQLNAGSANSQIQKFDSTVRDKVRSYFKIVSGNFESGVFLCSFCKKRSAIGLLGST